MGRQHVSGNGNSYFFMCAKISISRLDHRWECNPTKCCTVTSLFVNNITKSEQVNILNFEHLSSFDYSVTNVVH